MTDLPSANRPLASRDDLDPAERMAVRRALGIGLAALVALVLSASALVTFAPERPDMVAFLGP